MRVYRFVLRLVRDQRKAEDLISEVFLDVWRQADRFEGRSTVSTWLLAIARFKALSVLRRKPEEGLDEDAALAARERTRRTTMPDSPDPYEDKAEVPPTMKDTPADVARVRRCSIILVHGTWGRGFFPKRHEASQRNKRWFEEGSQFRAGLEAALKSASLDWPIRAFLWSGANSVRARDGAARALSDELRTELKDDPDARAVIIAHSHGGNVALRALQQLNSVAGQIKVVTLATPFLRVFAHRFHLSILPALLVLFSLSVIFVICYLTGLNWILYATGLSPDDFLYLAIFAVVLLVLGIGTGLFFTIRLFAIFANLRAALAIEEEASYDTKGMAASRMLAIRGVDDEASLSLAAGSIGSRLSYLVLVGVIPAIWLIIMIIGPQLVSLGGGAWVRPVLVFYGAMLFSPILLFLPGVFKSVVFGRKFLVNALVCDIAVDSVPDTLGQVEAITLKPFEAASSEHEWQSYFPGIDIKYPYSSESFFSLPWWSEIMRISWRDWRTRKFKFLYLPSIRLHKFSLRHAIYDHPHCVNEIVRWLRRVI
jgi:RNA polymerase sigma factor (sigma-70 family)